MALFRPAVQTLTYFWDEVSQDEQNTFESYKALSMKGLAPARSLPQQSGHNGAWSKKALQEWNAFFKGLTHF